MMYPLILPILILVLITGLIYIFLVRKNKPRPVKPLHAASIRVLETEVHYYQQLDAENKLLFQDRIQRFLSKVRITGVNTTVEETDRMLIGASAVIPVFGFPGWEYTNLNEVLLYPDAFNETFEQEGENRYTLGLVGTGAFQDIMILSQPQLLDGYRNPHSRSNPGIHEFVHLVDKTGGVVDGIPEAIMLKKYIQPWRELMQAGINKILEYNSDINPYGATNEGEFFAVVAEYFFKQPHVLKDNHPDLYKMLSNIFNQDPVSNFLH